MNSTYEAPRRLIKSAEDIEKMRVAGRLAAEVLDMIKPHIKPGVTTLELDTICHDYIVNKQDAIPACLGYGAAPGRPAFQHVICTSVNHVVCHGIPSDAKVLKKGDILNIDVTVIKDGFHGDTNMMYIVGGETSILANRLCKVAQEAMYRGIATVKPGSTIGDIGHAIQQYVESERFGVVREYCGHGIGTVFHDEPQVLHYGQPNSGMILEEGMNQALQSQACDVIGIARIMAIEPDVPKYLLAGKNGLQSVHPIKTGIKKVDSLGIMEVLWYTQQLKRMGKAKEPKPHESGLWAFIKSILRSGWGTYATQRNRIKS